VPDPAVESWVRSHVEVAAREIVEFFAAEQLSLEGARIADLGCGDGLIDLGLALQARPAELVGFDVDPPPRLEDLGLLVEEYGLGPGLPAGLSFRQSSHHTVPAEDASFEFAFSWSTFQFLLDVPAVCAELARILVPDGTLMVQVYPFYFSQHGDNSVGEPFTHLIEGEPAGPEGVVHNRITLDSLQHELIDAGFRIGRVSLLHDLFHLPAELARWPLSALAITGVKLLATKESKPISSRPERSNREADATFGLSGDRTLARPGVAGEPYPRQAL